MIVVAVSGLALASGIYVASRRNAVTAANVNDVPPPTGRRHRRLTTREDSSVHIDWATLAAVAVVAAAAALTVVLLVAFALVGLSGPRPGRQVDGPDGVGLRHPPRPSARPSPGSACSPPGSSSATACT